MSGDNARPMPRGDHCEHKNCAAKRICSWAWTCAHRYCPALGSRGVAESDPLRAHLDEVIAKLAQTTKERATAYRQGWERGREDAARLCKQTAAEDDESDLGERMGDAFNAAAHRPMSERLRNWNAELAAGIRAIAPPQEGS